MRLSACAFLVASLALAPVQALAAAADGAWECRSFGLAIATIGFDGEGYILANHPKKTGGRGEIVYTGNQEFTVSDGPLLYELNLEEGKTGLDNGEPLLTLSNRGGEQLFCYKK